MTPCHCTGECRELGYCPRQQRPYWPHGCGHAFPWYGIFPPAYCPICGAYIGPIYTGPPKVTYHFHTTAPQPQGGTISSE